MFSEIKANKSDIHLNLKYFLLGNKVYQKQLGFSMNTDFFSSRNEILFLFFTF